MRSRCSRSIITMSASRRPWRMSPVASTPKRSTPDGMSVDGATTRTLAPSVVSRMMFERATRECRMSPQMAITSPSTPPLLRRIVRASSSAWVGCSCAPSPALTTEQSTFCASSSTAPDAWWRTTMMSGRMALSVTAVSISVSPLRIEEEPVDMFITSAPSRLPASSNDAWVRVETSKNRFIRVRPRSEVRFFSIWRLSSTNSSARSSRPTMSSMESPSIPRRWRRLRTNDDFGTMFIKAAPIGGVRRRGKSRPPVMLQSVAKGRIFPKRPVFPRRPAGRRSEPSAVEKASVLAPSVEDAGDELHPDVAAALPAQLAAPPDAAVGGELQGEFVGRRLADQEDQPGAGVGHVLQQAGLYVRAWSEIDPDALANLPSPGLALFRHALKFPDGPCTRALDVLGAAGRSGPLLEPREISVNCKEFAENTAQKYGPSANDRIPTRRGIKAPGPTKTVGHRRRAADAHRAS